MHVVNVTSHVFFCNYRFGYEAAVCGGIPIINTLQTDFLSDQITKIMGIMNGTTNFMLCKMEDEGADYGAVLREAQSLGFAEADPTADVEGHDVQAKIALLGKDYFYFSDSRDQFINRSICIIKIFPGFISFFN